MEQKPRNGEQSLEKTGKRLKKNNSNHLGYSEWGILFSAWPVLKESQ